MKEETRRKMDKVNSPVTPKSANFTPASADKRRLPACKIKNKKIKVNYSSADFHRNNENVLK